MPNKVKYRYVGENPQDLASGAFVGMGDFVSLSAEDEKNPHNAALIEDGKLVKIEGDK